MACKFSENLESNNLYFRPFCESDAIDMFEYSSDLETVKYLSWSPHKTIEQSIESIVGVLNRNGVYAIVLKSNNKVIGCIDFELLDDKKATFGYVLNREYWNRGYMSETLSLFIEYIFNNLDIVEIIGLHEVDNIASGKVMQKCKMKFRFCKKNENINNRVADYNHYSIKRCEFDELNKKR